MAKEVARRELLQRWSAIEQEDDDDDGDLSSVHPIKRHRLRQLKEQWFSDAFSFLINAPKENHVWCGYWDLMGPLLETFYNYFKEEARDSPLKILWNRISGEMRHCTLCVHQHHQAQEMYYTEYEQSCINPLLDVLRTLDEERISQHLKDLNSRIVRGEYDQSNDYGEVVSVMFEVLMFPILLDDQCMATEFQRFIEVIDNSHELTLDGHQQYPGVYALFFSQSRRVRSIGLRLAGHMGKLRISIDLDPLQNLLKKWISILEMEGVKPAIETPRPRVQLDRVTVWLGMKALVGFLEPPAFEEGILDRYPIFLSIVLNHISDDSVEFSHAVNCLRLLFEKLGYKLWLRATLSPGVMRNTLLGQCFHTRNEKSHKEIFDLFQPFLQSLEALQDGEHEKQRRHFLYFLLHQVPVSSNFSTLMRKKACQIALLIIIRGYRMDPPSPPFECVHMWGPSLVSSLKDSSLHSSLQQPAFDLIQTIIVSDASALMSIILNGQLHPSDKPVRPTNYVDVEDEEDILSDIQTKEKDVSCWKDFNAQHKTISQVDGTWMCVPMLWFDVLVETDPMVLPFTFSKAVFWALSRFSLIEPNNSTEMALPVRNWLSTCAPEISYLLGWKVPSGSDDGGNGTESRNSIRTSTMCLPLVKTFKRFTAHYIVRMEQQELRKNWTWEPMMSSSLILFLVDPNDNSRQVGRLILEKVSNVRGLTGGLQFLCSMPSSLSATLFGLRHALELVHLDSVLLNFRTLHHLFFIMCKLLKEGNSSAPTASQNPSDVSDVSKFSSEGGFLKQPVCDSSPADCDGHSSSVSSAMREKFCCILSQVAWPSILKCLEGGKPFTDYTVSQMTCIRLLEVMPVVFERIPIFFGSSVETPDNIKWLHDLADWGKSSLAVVVRYWKQTLASLLSLMKESCSNKSASAIHDIVKLILCETISIDEVSKQVARLSVSLMDEGTLSKKSGFQLKHSPYDEFVKNITSATKNSEPLIYDKEEISILEPEPVINEEGRVIILSDDEGESEKSEVSARTELAQDRSSQGTHVDRSAGPKAVGRESNADQILKDFTTHDELMGSPELCDQPSSSHTTVFGTEKMRSNKMGSRQAPPLSLIAEPDSKQEEKKTEDSVSVNKDKNSNLKNKPDETVNSKQSDSRASQVYTSNKVISALTSTRKVQHNVIKPLKTTGEVKEVEHDSDDDPWQFSFFKQPRRQQGLVTKPIASGPKRQIIQLSVPVNNRSGSMRMDRGVKRFKPPRLDEWYRPILELDFFVAVGLASGTDNDPQQVTKLKEVPVCFQSPDEYVEIFRPLVLEEFKAQLQRSYQENSSTEEMYCGSLSVLSVEKNDDFHVVRFLHDDNKSTVSKSLMENDLILLTRQPLQNSACDVHAVGKVERREKDNKRRLNISAIRLYLQGSTRLNRVRKLLTERSKWHVSRVMSITPQLREFQALSSIREIPLLPVILNPVNHPCGKHESRTEKLNKLSQPLQKVIKSSYNSSQLQAISLAIGPFDLKKDFDLTLIQGPPGTGKTRTIVAIVSGLLVFSQMKDTTRLRNGGPIYSNSSSTKERISESAAIARAWQDAALAKQCNEVAEMNKFTGSCTSGRILICAQSNAAVDELVARISSQGLYGSNGLVYKPYLVRIGNAKTVHPNSLPFFIDTLVENRLMEENRNSHDEKKIGTTADSLTVIRDNLEKLMDQIRSYEAKRANIQEGNSDSKNLVEGECGDIKGLSDAELKVTLRKLYERKKALYTDLANVQARERKASEELRALRHKFRTAILKEAEIVVTTLSGCGGDLYGVCSESTSAHKFVHSPENALFDAVVVDEAAQALEPATLIPLQLLKSWGTKCIMVGDPKQLPATVLSNVASKYSFQCSMFERLQRAGHPVIMLTQQYRMHPEICRFPSLHFYDDELLNGDQMSSKAAPFHETRCLGPYVFFDIVDGQEMRGKNASALSMYNECEADAAVEVLRYLKKRYPSEFYGERIGIITPYKSQLSLLRSRFSSAFGSSVASEMEFNTVDGFQGREVDILLFSTVRAAGSCSETPGVRSSNIGFVADVRRMNVALTRARLSLWVFGNARTLQTNQSWAALVGDAKQRNLVVSARKPYSSIHKFGLDKGSSSGNQSHVEQADMVKTITEPVDTPKVVKHSSEIKRKHTSTLSGNVRAATEDVSSVEKDVARYNKKRIRDRSSPSKNNSVSNIGKSTVKENRDNSAHNRAYRESAKERNWFKADVGETKDIDGKSHLTDTGKMKIRSGEHVKFPNDERSTKTTKHDKKWQEAKLGASSSERNSKEKNEKGSDQVEIQDSIRKRKEQREAVDALLSSALISSKKSVSSLKSSSSERTSSTKNTISHPTRLKKSRKDS